MSVYEEFTSKGWRLPFVGKIKVGGAEWVKTKDGRNVRKPIKYDYFVVTSIVRDGKLEDQLHPIFYPMFQKKRTLPITFPSDNIKDILLLEYGVFRMEKKLCLGNGETYERDETGTGKITTGVCNYASCPFGKKNGCKLNMSLRVLLRAPNSNHAFTGGYFVFQSSGVKTIRSITANLLMAKEVFGYLAGLPAFLVMDNNSSKVPDQQKGGSNTYYYHYERLEFLIPLEEIKGKNLMKPNSNINMIEPDLLSNEKQNGPIIKNNAEVNNVIKRERTQNVYSAPQERDTFELEEDDLLGFDLPDWEQELEDLSKELQ